MIFRIFTKLKAPIVSSTLFFTGIVLSIGALYVLPAYPSWIDMDVVYALVGLTFLAGLFSVHLTARSVKQTVVYLEPKKEEEKIVTQVTESDNQLTLDSIENILQSGQAVSQNIINNICKQLEAGQAALYTAHESTLQFSHGYAVSSDEFMKHEYRVGEGLIGRVAKEARSLYIDKLPEGHIVIFSGLGSSSPTHLVIIPLVHNEEVKGVLEIALFRPLSKNTILQLENIGNAWAKTGL
ncbi:MAG TPA: GAF domain-containing protein [Cyclobacteriaceae bacterium]|nr:GAF domain-containing protein [Cyclobacteriaceae bacterium]